MSRDRVLRGRVRPRFIIVGAALGLLVAQAVVDAQQPAVDAVAQRRELSKLHDAFAQAKRTFAAGQWSAFDDAEKARQQLASYAQQYLDTSPTGKHRGVYLWMLGITYEWQGQLTRARVEFERCVENTKIEEKDCLGTPCSVVCARAAERLQNPDDPFLAAHVTIDAKNGRHEVAERPTFVSERLERSEERLKEIASRRALVGHFDDVRPMIDAALSDRADEASVHATDSLVVYVFGGDGESSAKWWHEKLTKQSEDMRNWLFGADQTTQSDSRLLLVVYINLDGDGASLSMALHGTNAEFSRYESPALVSYYQPLGYFEPLDNSVVVLHTTTPKSLGTARHEVVHSLLREDFGNIPRWLNEGIAALYEATLPSKGTHPTPLDNWRIDYLVDNDAKRASANLPKLGDFVDPACQNWGDEYYPIASALARYFAWFLLDNDQLATVYQRLRAGEPHVLVFEQVARDLAAVRKRELLAEEDPFVFLQGEFEQFIAHRVKRTRTSSKFRIEPIIDRSVAAGRLASTPTCVAVDAIKQEFPTEALFDLLDTSEPQPPTKDVVPLEPAPPNTTSPPGCACTSAAGEDDHGVVVWLLLLMLVLNTRSPPPRTSTAA